MLFSELRKDYEYSLADLLTKWILVYFPQLKRDSPLYMSKNKAWTFLPGCRK